MVSAGRSNGSLSCVQELKSYAKPPAIVKKVLECVCILLGLPPTWANARKEMGDQGFLARLQSCDKTKIDKKRLKLASKYYTDPEFTPEAVGKVSAAAKPLCIWCRAMMAVDVATVIEPKKLVPAEPTAMPEPAMPEPAMPEPAKPASTAQPAFVPAAITRSSIEGGIFGDGPLAAPVRGRARKHIKQADSLEGGIFGGGAYAMESRRAVSPPPDAMESRRAVSPPLALPQRPATARYAADRNKSSIAGGIFGAGAVDAPPARPATTRTNSSIPGGIFGLGPVADATLSPPARFKRDRNASGIPGGIFGSM